MKCTTVRKRIHRIIAGAAFLAALALASVADAGKPAPPPPPAEAGTLFFLLGSSYTSGDVYAMKADGTGLAKVVNGADVVAETTHLDITPSSRTYAGEHWWLWTAPREDGATHPGSTIPIEEFFVGIPGQWKVRVTNLWNDYHIAPSASPQMTWSNDNADTFFSFLGRERIQNPVTGAWSNGSINVYKIPFGVVADAETGAPLPAMVTEPAVDADGAPLVDGDGNSIERSAIAAIVPQLGWNQQGFSWSPDGSTVLYQWFEETFTDTGSQQYRVKLLRHSTGGPDAPYPMANGAFVMVTPADEAPVLVWTDDRLTGALTGPQALAAQLSPDGGRIAFGRFNGTSSVGRDVLTISSSASDLIGLQGTTTVLTGRYLGYSRPLWSPANGSQIVAREVDGRKGIDVSKWPRNLVRVPSTGGSPLKLTGALDPLAEKTALGWRLGFPWTAGD